MTLSAGSRLGPYEVQSALGKGGMGEVYRARDSKLGREVAIKVLPESFANDADRLARFTREAQTLASLNHPNIAQIFGLEGRDGQDRQGGGTGSYFVMELVEGEDLSALIARGPMAFADALPIATQIAEALEAAHEKGIIHRDLKPANVKVTPSGKVKVLDFGLAKMMEMGTGVAGSTGAKPVPMSMSPTLGVQATYAGVILGTAAYMSPEQARGRPVDTRTDLWAFGCVLYEMLTGRKVFDEGETVSDAVAAILKNEVNWAALPADTPAGVRRLLRRCLEKERSRRLHSAADARLEIEDAHAEPARTAPGVAPAPSRGRERLAWGAAGAFALLAAGALAWTLRPERSAPETRLEITTLATDDVASIAISPDGRRIVFVGAARGGQSQLWLRRFDQTIAQPLAGTENATFPFWSPDSRSVAFYADNTLKRVDVGSGSPQALASVPGGARGGAWNADGVILVATTTGPLVRVPATGGELVPVTTFAAGQNAHRFPHFLPGGRQFVFNARGQDAVAGLYLGTLDGSEIKRLGPSTTSAVFLPPGRLLFLRQGTLLAQAIDLNRGELTGEPVSVADQVASDSNSAAAAFSVSTDGSIAYRTGGSMLTQLTWFDRLGKAVGTIGEPDSNGLLQPALSPDGRRVVAYRTVQNNTDLWLYDSARMTRLTFDASREMYPIWSADGARLTFSKEAKGPLDLFEKPSGGGANEQLVLASSRNNYAPQSWSSDGRFLIYLERNPDTAGDLWVMPADGKQRPFVFLKTKFEERAAQFSPDGRWVVYSSDESGRPEVYVRPFPASSGQWQVSTMGGVAPRWRRDGKELYYVAPDGRMMASPFSVVGRMPELGAPVALFQTRIMYGGTSGVGIMWQYDVSADGRFLINVNTGDAGTSAITIVQNWTPGE